jgi:hypothetical protein
MFIQARGMQDVEVATQFANHAGHQVHHKGVAVNFGQVGDVAAARRTDSREVVTRQVNQHQMLGKLFMVGAHFQFDTAVEIAIQRSVGAAPRGRRQSGRSQSGG